MFDAILRDIRYALRSLRLNPGFAAVAVLTLALGVGANTAFFQLIDAVRLRPLPVDAPEQLVELRLADMTHARGTWFRDRALTNPLWERIRQQQDAFAGLIAWADEPVDVSLNGESKRLAGLWVSGDFFKVLGVRPAVGRVFTAEDDYRGCGDGAGAVISHGFWQREFGGDPSIVGRQLMAGATRFEVVGVAPRSFFGLEVGRTFDIAMPLCAVAAWQASNSRLDSGNLWWLTVIGRLKSGVSLEEAGAFVAAASPSIFAATLPHAYPAASVKPYLDMALVALPADRGISRVRDEYAGSLMMLFAIAGFVLMIVCANLAHLVLARTYARQRDLAVRLALGASRLRLARQAFVESLLLATAGSAAGLLVARMLSHLIVSFLATGGAGVSLDLPLDGRVLAFTAALTLLVCLVMAAVPVRRAAGATPGRALKQDVRVTSGAGRSVGRRAMLATQIALSLTLLSGTLLFARSLRNLQTVDAGFQQQGLVIADVNFSDLRLTRDRAVSFRNVLLERILANPTVEAASEALIVPLTGGNWNNSVWMAGSDPEGARTVYRNMIGARYFQTLRAQLLAGREFENHDMGASTKVAIVNQAFVAEFGLGPNVIGERVWLEQTPYEPRTSYEIVGLVENTKYRDLREDLGPTMFVPLSEAALARPIGQFLVRAAGDHDVMVSSMRTTLTELSPSVRTSFRPLDAVVRESLVRERLLAIVAGPFGLLAVVLTALGLYGVISYTVSLRTKEIGIRIALGADRRVVLMSLMREAAGVVLTGLAAGTALTLIAGHAAAGLLFGVEAYDLVSLSAATATIAAVAAGATWLPAWRAARIDPVMALRGN